MRAIISAIFMLIATTSFADNCNLHEFKWECRQPVQHKQSAYHSEISYCGDSYVYLTKHQRNTLNEYLRANINVVLKVNGEYIDSPCE